MDDLKQKAREVNEQHGDKIEEGVDRGADSAKRRFGEHEDKIDAAASRAKDYLGRDAEQR